MKSTILALALAGAASAHTTVWNVLVNGKDQGVGNKAGGYIDSPPNNNPVLDVSTKDIECNVAGTKASKSISANPGDELAFQWYHDTNSAGDDIIASSHKGPIMVYASKAGSSMSWTKVWEDKAITDGKYAVDRLLAGSYTGVKGQHKMKIPAGLAAGEYIFRPEILALHEGTRAKGAQFYMECVHVTVGGSGSTALPAGASLPGAYKQDEAGVMFNIYGGATTYPGVGPAVWSGAASSAAEPAAPATTPSPAPVAAEPATQPSTMATVAKPAETPAPGAGAVSAQKYAQCGGHGYTGATACASGATCTKQNDYYSQCI